MSGTVIRKIPDEARLLRRAHPKQVVWDSNKNTHRISSAAFRDKEMSVDVEDFLEEDGLTAQFSVQSYPGYSLARLTAGSARSIEQVVSHVPITGNKFHAEVQGSKSPGKAQRLLESSHPVFLIVPPSSA